MMHRAEPERPGVRAEVRHAKEQAADQDPSWLKIYWPVWLAVVAIGFAVAEAIAIVSPGKGGTLTERIKLWLGVDPPAPRRRVSSAGFVAVLAVFAVWFSVHIAGSWPWEGGG